MFLLCAQMGSTAWTRVLKSKAGVSRVKISSILVWDSVTYLTPVLNEATPVEVSILLDSTHDCLESVRKHLYLISRSCIDYTAIGFNHTAPP